MPSPEGEFSPDFVKQAVEILVHHQQATISLLQRRLLLGYSKAQRLMMFLEEEGFVLAASEAGKRDLAPNLKNGNDCCRVKNLFSVNQDGELIMEVFGVVEIFKKEFDSVCEKFFIYDLALNEAASCAEEHVWKPGVYVFWRPAGVVKVGRHLTNARKRALEHIRDNTGGSMAELADDPDARLILFTLKDPENMHWAAAVEIFLERELKPEIRSGRLG